MKMKAMDEKAVVVVVAAVVAAAAVVIPFGAVYGNPAVTLAPSSLESVNAS